MKKFLTNPNHHEAGERALGEQRCGFILTLAVHSYLFVPTLSFKYILKTHFAAREPLLSPLLDSGPRVLGREGPPLLSAGHVPGVPLSSLSPQPSPCFGAARCAHLDWVWGRAGQISLGLPSVLPLPFSPLSMNIKRLQ